MSCVSISQADIDALMGGGGGGAVEEPQPQAASPTTGHQATPVRELRRILGLTVPVSVALAERDMTVESILGLSVGSIIEFEKSFDADLDLLIANQLIGAGQAAKVGENFGLRITHVGSVHERIGAMSGR